MWDKENKETLQSITEHLAIFSTIQTDPVPPTELLVLAKKATDLHVTDILTGIISEAYKTPSFLLDMASEKPKQEVVGYFEEVKKQIQNFIRLQEHPDNLPEILYGQREFGCVYLPTELLKQLYALGESVFEYQATKRKDNGLDVHMLKVMTLASEWVEFSLRKWGKTLNAELTVVSPLTPEEARNALPDKETPPPF